MAKFKRIEFEREKGEHFDTLRLSLRLPKLGLPKETSEHLMNAKSEIILAARTIIDKLAECLARLGTKQAPSQEEPIKQD